MSLTEKDWFTVEAIDGRTFAISEYRHWEQTHCYLLLGSRRALLIDTGLGVGDIRRVAEELTALPITVATTHVHWDHIGGHGQFEDLLVFEAEAHWLSGQFPLPLPVVKSQLLRDPCCWPTGFHPEGYRIFQGEPTRILRDGDLLDLGNRQVQVIHTPGHSPGHCCFYEAEGKYLYTGDLIYKGCLYAFYPTTDPRLFMQSVRRVAALTVDRLLPGHHQLDIPASLIAKVSAAFDQICAQGKLHHGGGLFDFGDFQIHV